MAHPGGGVSTTSFASEGPVSSGLIEFEKANNRFLKAVLSPDFPLRSLISGPNARQLTIFVPHAVALDDLPVSLDFVRTHIAFAHEDHSADFAKVKLISLNGVRILIQREDKDASASSCSPCSLPLGPVDGPDTDSFEERFIPLLPPSERPLVLRRTKLTLPLEDHNDANPPFVSAGLASELRSVQRTRAVSVPPRVYSSGNGATRLTTPEARIAGGNPLIEPLSQVSSRTHVNLGETPLNPNDESRAAGTAAGKSAPPSPTHRSDIAGSDLFERIPWENAPGAASAVSTAPLPPGVLSDPLRQPPRDDVTHMLLLISGPLVYPGCSWDSGLSMRGNSSHLSIAVPDGGGMVRGPTYGDFLAWMGRTEFAPLFSFLKKFTGGFPSVPSNQRPQEYQAAVNRALDHPCVEGYDRLRVAECVERFLTLRIFDDAFGGQEAADTALSERIRSLNFITPDQLEIPSDVMNPSVMDTAERELLQMNAYRAPKDKLDCIVNCSGVLLIDLTKNEKGGSGSADEFLPLLIYTVLRCNPSQLKSNIEYISNYRYGPTLLGETGCFFTHLISSVLFVESLDASVLRGVEPEEFERQMSLHVEQASTSGSREKPRPSAILRYTRSLLTPFLPNPQRKAEEAAVGTTTPPKIDSPLVGSSPVLLLSKGEIWDDSALEVAPVVNSRGHHGSMSPPEQKRGESGLTVFGLVSDSIRDFTEGKQKKRRSKGRGKDKEKDGSSMRSPSQSDNSMRRHAPREKKGHRRSRSDGFDTGSAPPGMARPQTHGLRARPLEAFESFDEMLQADIVNSETKLHSRPTEMKADDRLAVELAGTNPLFRFTTAKADDLSKEDVASLLSAYRQLVVRTHRLSQEISKRRP